MPKVASPKSPTNTQHTISSPAKRSPRKMQTIQVQDRSQWRSSRIPENVTINKSAATTNYHINVKDLQDLPCITSETSVKINGVDTIRPMYLYKERDVERKAWEKYGGPESFDKMLNDKADKFYAKHGTKFGKIFPKPSTYKLARDPTLAPYARIRVYPEHLPDNETSTPNLIRMKEKMETKGQRWLWDALNKIFEDDDLRGADRESLMLCAFDTLRKYPKRPTSPPPPNSVSFKALDELLADAPSGYHGPGIEEDYDHFTGDMSVDWVQSYKDKVYDCLDVVLEEHGIDELQKARWIVYDKYVECKMGGLWYDRLDNSKKHRHVNEYRWSDSAKFWLHERE